MLVSRHFETKGFAYLPQILSQDFVFALKGFLESQLEESLKKIKPLTEIQSLQDWVSGINRLRLSGALSRLDHECRNILSGHFCLETRLNPVLQTVVKQPALLKWVRRILGPGKVVMHMPPAARFVLPGNHFAQVPPHQDESYNQALGKFVTLWVPLVAIDEQCGGVTVFAGENQKRELGQADAFWLGAVSTDGLIPIHQSMKPGDVLALNPYIVHASADNASNRIRLSVDYRFYLLKGKAKKHYLDLETGEVMDPSG